MTIHSVQFVKDDEYYTPRYIVDAFGTFEYDPATNETKARELGISNFDTIETDGLTKDWSQYQKIWINPPFTEKVAFIKKAKETYDKCGNEIYILMPIGFMTTAKFHEIFSDGVFGMLYLPNGRINFESGSGKKGRSPAFGSIILKLGNKNGITAMDLKQLQK